MNRAELRILKIALLSFGVLGGLATGACMPSGDESDVPMTVPSVEILVLSRGRGVPEAARNSLQLIEAAAESARQSGLVVSIDRETIGLEGETRLCIRFRDRPALTMLMEEFRDLARNVDLLQMRVEENNCPEE